MSERNTKKQLKLSGSEEGSFMKLVNHRLDNNRDMKILITSKSASTGLGKTTLAIHLCNNIDRHGWSAKDKGFLEINNYSDYYKNKAKSGEALLLDEIERGADRRRSMSDENISVTHAWTTLRFKNVVTIGTLPTTAMLDKRLKMLADVWIHVIRKGLAKIYMLMFDDFNQTVRNIPLKDEYGREELIGFPELDNEDFRVMKKKKEEAVTTEKNIYSEKQLKHKINKAKETVEWETKKDIIKNLLEFSDFTQTKIADIVNCNQSTVSKVKNSQ